MKVFKIIWAVIQFPVFLIRDIIESAQEGLRPKCPICGGTLVFESWDTNKKTVQTICVLCGQRYLS